MMTKAKQHDLCFRQDIDIEPNATSALLYDSFKANDIPDLLQQVLLQHGSRYWREIDRGAGAQDDDRRRSHAL